MASLGLVSPGAANDWCHPIFFIEKSDDLFTFLVITSESDDLFSCRLLTAPIFPRRLSSVVSKFSHKKNNFWSDFTFPGGCHPGQSLPRHSALVTPLILNLVRSDNSDLLTMQVLSVCYFVKVTTPPGLNNVWLSVQEL